MQNAKVLVTYSLHNHAAAAIIVIIIIALLLLNSSVLLLMMCWRSMLLAILLAMVCLCRSLRASRCLTMMLGSVLFVWGHD